MSANSQNNKDLISRFLRVLCYFQLFILLINFGLRNFQLGVFFFLRIWFGFQMIRQYWLDQSLSVIYVGGTYMILFNWIELQHYLLDIIKVRPHNWISCGYAGAILRPYLIIHTGLIIRPYLIIHTGLIIRPYLIIHTGLIIRPYLIIHTGLIIRPYLIIHTGLIIRPYLIIHTGLILRPYLIILDILAHKL